MSFNANMGQQDEDKMKEILAAKKAQMGTDALSGAGAAGSSDSALGGAAQGAAVGGPVGAVAGAALGLVKGMAKQKAQKRALKAQSIKEQGDIAVQTADKQNQALQNIMNGLRASFIR